MAGKETIILLAMFDDVTAVDHAVDAYWDWSESRTDHDPEALGVLVRLDWGLDAQLIGDEDSYGTDTGPALDVFEALLDRGWSADQSAEENALSEDQILAALGLERQFVQWLRSELAAGRALMLLTVGEPAVDAVRRQLEEQGGETSMVHVSRQGLLQAASAVSGIDEDDDELLFEYDDGEYELGSDFDFDDDDYDYDSDDEDLDDYEEDGTNGRYR